MQYIKATKKQCEDYNTEVTQGENYKGETARNALTARGWTITDGGLE